jgi:hypothetical protein
MVDFLTFFPHVPEDDRKYDVMNPGLIMSISDLMPGKTLAFTSG